MWIWQHKEWPQFCWDKSVIEPLLRDVRLNQGILLGKMLCQSIDYNQSKLDSLAASIIHSSAIEGERLNAFSVRSSLANKLGVAEDKPFPTTEQTDGLAEIVIDSVDNLETPLTLERILLWHSLLFPNDYTTCNTVACGQLRGMARMQVVSGRIDKPIVHFEAPSRDILDNELSSFFEWFNESKADTSLDPLLRAAIAHFWFVTLHPLDDGNGRVARLVTDLALAQAERQSIRFYAMSVGILANQKSYYEILEQTQKGDTDITAWLNWFLVTLNETFNAAQEELEPTLFKGKFWAIVDRTQLRHEQIELLNRMLDGYFPDGVSTSLYHSEVGISKPTATRHLTRLVELGCVVKSGAGGRSTRYFLRIHDE
ncbi:hypothetical protein VSAK1_26105 [Vibrio mediterranei AK1]|uniref:Fic family protein n=1 Tax=Vibrio mediterranei TaxID=689 RepID=UPI0001541DFA|nr:Fic family protein [Vibrio mediterranei]EDL53715.1 hypothetical protein VSAK1_26105 [Vibrio mediterranei AK1]